MFLCQHSNKHCCHYPNWRPKRTTFWFMWPTTREWECFVRRKKSKKSVIIMESFKGKWSLLSGFSLAVSTTQNFLWPLITHRFRVPHLQISKRKKSMKNMCMLILNMFISKHLDAINTHTSRVRNTHNVGGCEAVLTLPCDAWWCCSANGKIVIIMSKYLMHSLFILLIRSHFPLKLTSITF